MIGYSAQIVRFDISGERTFPQRYFAYALQFRQAGVVLARDLVLVALLCVLAWPLRLARAG